MKKIFCLLVFLFSLCFGVDNSSLSQKDFLKHDKTYGVVFLIPQQSVQKVFSKTKGLIQETLLQNNLLKETLHYNIPHISVIHIHNPDPNTPYKMLLALPKPPKPFSLNLNHYIFTKASPNTKSPWWFQIGVEKNLNYADINQYNFEVVKAIAPLRATPVPRATGEVYKYSDEKSKSQIFDLGTNGLNQIKDNQIQEDYRPHMTLIYSRTPLSKPILDAMQNLQKHFNEEFKTPIKADFNTVSIVELGFLGNVLREIYRINLTDGKIYDVEKEKFINPKRP